MKENSLKEKPFSSWKEISAYLGCDERTCLRWERKYGLPVHRAGSRPSKSLVFAYKEELDEWLKRREEKKTPGHDHSSPAFARLAKKLPWALAALGAVALVLFGLWKLLGKSTGSEVAQPYDFRIERSEFIAVNKKGTELWRYDTKLASLVSDAGYRTHFPCRKGYGNNERLLPWLKIKDINGDGRTEVLFIIRTLDDDPQSELLCFDGQGRKLWTYEPGREMLFGTRNFSADYALDAVDVLNASPSAPNKILILARHKPNYPSYIAILSPKGETLGEYWNSGRFSDYALLDIDSDGIPALILAGTNNEYGKGFLAVLDTDFVWGGSPQTGDYRCAGLKPGAELFYILFPRTIVDQLEFGPREVISYIDNMKNNRIMAIPFLSRIIFELNARMEIDSVAVSDAFREKYRKYQEEGKIPPGRLDEQALADSLAKGVVYFDGERWTTTPTRNKKNSSIYLQKESKT